MNDQQTPAQLGDTVRAGTHFYAGGLLGVKAEAALAALVALAEQSVDWREKHRASETDWRIATLRAETAERERVTKFEFDHERGIRRDAEARSDALEEALRDVRHYALGEGDTDIVAFVDRALASAEAASVVRELCPRCLGAGRIPNYTPEAGSSPPTPEEDDGRDGREDWFDDGSGQVLHD